MSSQTPEERILTGTTWNDFCETLKKAGSVIMGENNPADPFNRAEGFRYLSRIMRTVSEAFMEYSDPRAPVLFRPVHETAKMGSDNPDNYYQHATVSGRYEYRITGTRGTIHYLGFGTYRGNYGSAGPSGETGYLEGDDLAVNDDGTVEILVSKNKKPGNWLPMEEDTSSLIVRQTFLDRENEAIADLTIERIDSDEKPGPVTPAQVDQALTTSANIVLGAATLFANWANGFKAHTNELPEFDQSVSMAAHGDPNICYFHSYWELAPDEALVIDATPPECDHWNFQLNNHWMESLDYRFHTIHVNRHSAAYNDDGSVTIVVAHTDPGVPNWIETAGHDRGTMCFRWIKAEEHPQPTTRVVKLSELTKAVR